MPRRLTDLINEVLSGNMEATVAAAVELNRATRRAQEIISHPWYETVLTYNLLFEELFSVTDADDDPVRFTRSIRRI